MQHPTVPSQPGPAHGTYEIGAFDGPVFPSDSDTEFLTLAVETALRSVAAGDGPFGAVVVHRSLVLGMGTNEVTRSFDPTAHAEVVAIRAASRRLARTVLDDCVLYASCEPCPLCLAACRWAGLPRVVHASSRASAIAAGYADELHFETFAAAAESPLLVQQAWLENAGEPFRAWRRAYRAS